MMCVKHVTNLALQIEFFLAVHLAQWGWIRHNAVFTITMCNYFSHQAVSSHVNFTHVTQGFKTGF